MLAFAAAPAMAKKEAGPGGQKKKKDRAGKKERKPGARGKKAPRQSGMVKQIMEVCGLSADQQVALQEALRRHTDAQKAAKEKSADLRKAMAEARKAKDKAKMRELAKEMKELQAPVQAALAEAMKTLTPEQQAKWEAHKMAAPVIGRFKKLGLNDDQVKAIEDLCAKKAAELKGADPKAARKIKGSLMKEITENILTADQKANMKAPREKREKKPRPPKGEKRKKKNQ